MIENVTPSAPTRTSPHLNNISRANPRPRLNFLILFRFGPLLSAVSAGALATGCATVPPRDLADAPPIVQPPAPAASAHDQLFKLFADSDEDELRRAPITALFRGDLRYADQLGDFFSDAQAERGYQSTLR